MGTRQCISRSVRSPRRYILPQRGDGHHQNISWNMQASFHPIFPHGQRDNCVSRGTCPQDVVNTVTTWLPNHYKRGNGVLQGTFCSLRGFLLPLLNCRAVFNLISSAPGSKGAVFLLLSSTGALLGFGCWGLLFVIPVINAKILTKKFHSIFISFQLGKQTRNYT